MFIFKIYFIEKNLIHFLSEFIIMFIIIIIFINHIKIILYKEGFLFFF